jgi:DNA topoisomerase-1
MESATKAKTVEQYLGADYKVVASTGHLRDLPKSKIGVNIEKNFEPDYVPIKGREDIIATLRSAAKKSDKVFLATDPDREGEAIAWHLKELLGLSDKDTYRVTFNEITKKVVLDGMQNPRKIDEDLVNAQQARRILDRIVGYQISPLLWKKIRRGLSAGRVQSVTTRIVVDREEEIRAFNSEEYWLLDADLKPEGTGKNTGKFTARFHGIGKKETKITSEEMVNGIISAVSAEPFVIDSVKRQDRKRRPSPPFITSSLQQEASRKLGMTPRRTMSIAQQLYEGVDVKGEGTMGLITYMRTDSLRLSEEALADAAAFIKSRYGKDYYPGEPTRFKAKAGAQDAHEAIRPSHVELAPDEIRNSLTKDQYNLYKLIWSRFLASQMSEAIYDSMTIDAVSAGYLFRAKNEAVKFPGFMALYIEGSDTEEEVNSTPLPDLKEGSAAALLGTKKEQKFTLPPPRYTEATLIKAMEDTGIGRPSTYAATVSTITDREYVVKEEAGKHLRPTPLGEVVTGLMKDRFEDIVDVKFTARMEETLDSVERGDAEWHDVLAKFYDGFSKSLTDAETALEGERIKVPDELSDEVCDVCGKQMVIKSGRFGRFLACPGYPDCTFTKPIVVEMPGKCPICGGRILKRTSKNGYTYYGCENMKECGFLTWDVPVVETCPECGQTLFKKSGRGSKKPFCINEKCAAFVPEDKRGGFKKKAPAEATESPAGDAAPAKKSAAKRKPAAKKTAAKKPTTKKKAAKKS